MINKIFLLISLATSSSISDLFQLSKSLPSSPELISLVNNAQAIVSSDNNNLLDNLSRFQSSINLILNSNPPPNISNFINELSNQISTLINLKIERQSNNINRKKWFDSIKSNKDKLREYNDAKNIARQDYINSIKENQPAKYEDIKEKNRIAQQKYKARNKLRQQIAEKIQLSQDPNEIKSLTEQLFQINQQAAANKNQSLSKEQFLAAVPQAQGLNIDHSIKHEIYQDSASDLKDVKSKPDQQGLQTKLRLAINSLISDSKKALHKSISNSLADFPNLRPLLINIKNSTPESLKSNADALTSAIKDKVESDPSINLIKQDMQSFADFRSSLAKANLNNKHELNSLITQSNFLLSNFPQYKSDKPQGIYNLLIKINKFLKSYK